MVNISEWVITTPSYAYSTFNMELEKERKNVIEELMNDEVQAATSCLILMGDA